MSTSSWKKGRIADGLLSGLHSKRGGSLVVQTGFPTSLADLIVKNHDRLKKLSRKKKMRPPTSFDPAPAAPSPASGGGESRFPAPDCRSGSIAIEKRISADKNTDFRLGFRFLVGNMILLAALVIGKKGLVLGITISAFALLILEIFGKRAGRFLNLCPDARKCLGSGIGTSDLGGRRRPSPIRKVGIEFHADSSLPDRKFEESRVLNRISEFLEESSDLAAVSKDCGDGNLGSCANSKLKKQMGKFMAKKFGGRGEGASVPDCIDIADGELLKKKIVKAEEEGDSDGKVLSFRTCYDDLGDGEDLHRNVDRNRLGLVFFPIVLCGLVRGRAVALLLLLAWCFLCKFIVAVLSKRKMRPA